MNKPAVNILPHVFWCTYHALSVRNALRMELLVFEFFLYWVLIDANSLLNCIFQLALPWQWVSIPVALHSDQHRVLSFSFSGFVGVQESHVMIFNLCPFTGV